MSEPMTPCSTSPTSLSRSNSPAELSELDTALSSPTSIFSSTEESDSSNRATAEKITNELLSLYNKICRLPSLKPCLEVNNLFEQLVGLCVQDVDDEIAKAVTTNSLVQEILPNLRKICSQSESELESHWANFIALCPNPETGMSSPHRFLPNPKKKVETNSPTPANQTLHSFPYHKNYQDLTDLELSAIRDVHPDLNSIKKIAFIGSGPLPLSSLCLLESLNSSPLPFSSSENANHGHRVKITNIDISFSSLSLSEFLCSVLGPLRNAPSMSFLHSDAGNLPPGTLQNMDIVFLAALVGDSQGEKEKLIKKVVEGMRENALLVVGEGTQLGVKWEAVLHPDGDVVNSVFVGRVVKGKARS
ncbi:hypothetical protein G7Y89_g5233 [Cudoniella acicularis]|uniref:Nicotianamine synthase n=1 Tax=Cudoniella acicularis TaxID=354080 RepID=A0A8H4W3Z5_9HELO|nr:hypothetical protein G7Y89_g5233 [Cudoniella acicularis]